MNIVSIHGVPRSGTTWLQSIFNSNKNIKTIYQPLFSYKFKNMIDKNSTKQQWDKFINGMIETEDDFCTMQSDLHTNNGMFKNEYKKKIDINCLMMKNVHHHNLMEKFIQLQPDIKIIGIVRSPFSIVYSQMTAKREKLVDWFSGKDKNMGKKENYFGLQKWKQFNDEIYSLKQKYPKNVSIVVYENLVYNPYEQVKRLCKECNITFTRDMVNFIQKSITTNESYDYSVNRTEDTINKWKGKLDNNIVNYILEYIQLDNVILG